MKKLAIILFLALGIACLALPLRAQEPQTEAMAPAGTDEDTDIVAGKVTAIDAAQNTLSVTDEAGKSYTLAVTKEETSIWKGDDTIELTDVKQDNSVELEYYKNKDGKLVAIWIDVLVKESEAPAEAQAPETTAPAAEETTPAPAQ